MNGDSPAVPPQPPLPPSPIIAPAQPTTPVALPQTPTAQPEVVSSNNPVPLPLPGPAQPPSLSSLPSFEPASSNTPQTLFQSNDAAQAVPGFNNSVDWTASEFIAHHKTALWYVQVMSASLILASLIFLFTKDKVTTASIVVIAAVFCLYATRKPQILEYRLDSDGLTIRSKLYHYDQFRSFALLKDGVLPSIMLVPLRRFMPLMTIYYDPQDEADIAGILASHLPMDQRQLDIIDRFMQKIHF